MPIDSAVSLPVLTLYWREYCHLCHDMRDALASLHAELSAARGGGPLFSVEQRDVDADPALEALYDERVPVLVAGDIELCHYFLDRQAVIGWIASLQPSGHA